jgi:5-methylcytosine-specific restriction protein A
VPYAPLRPCSHPTCGALVARGRCPKHQKQKQQRLDEDAYRKLAKAFDRSKAWLDCRREVLARDPVCKRCHRSLSTVGAHKSPLRWCIENNRMDLAADPSNVEGTCKRCHDKESGQQARAKQLAHR